MSYNNPYENYGGDYSGYGGYDYSGNNYNTVYDVPYYGSDNPVDNPSDNGNVGTSPIDSGVTVSNDVNNTGSTGSTTVTTVATSPTTITTVATTPKTFADLIFSLQPTQPREVNLPVSPSITTLPTVDSGGNNTALFVILAVIGIGLTVWYAKHKSL